MFGKKMEGRLEQMLDDAIAGRFRESDYDESVLSRVECKWKQFLGSSVLSREALEKEKKNMQELVSDISHQTKTPIANLRLYTDLLKECMAVEAEFGQEKAGEDVIQEKGKKLYLLEKVEQQTEKLEFLIQSLTKLSRLESHVVELKPRRQNLSPLLHDSIADLRPRAQKKEIEFRNTYTGDGTACFDMKWTKEALENILDNAVKYSPCKSWIKISVIEYEMYAAVSVKDSGIGIKEEDTAKIFGRFYRAEEVGQEEGIGIGLYLAREILKRENGYIKVKSKPGQGAEFLLYLPTQSFQNR